MMTLPRLLFSFTLALACLPLQAAELGRLFFTPEQRQQLELGQLHGAAAAEGSPATLTVNGIVQKTGGKRTVWINGIPQTGQPANERKPSSTAVNIPGKSKSIEIKVGQQLLLDQSVQPADETPAQPAP